MKTWFPAIRAGSGADVYTIRLAEALRKRDVRAEIRWYWRWLELAPFLLRPTRVPPDVDVVVANSWNGHAFKRRGIPLVIVEHHCVLDPLYRPYVSLPQYLYHRALIKPYERASLARADAVVAVSEFTANGLRAFLGFERVRVIHNWIDVGKFKPRTPSEAEGRRRPFRLLYVGNLSRRKGADLLAPIMQALGRDFELFYTTGLRSGIRANSPSNMTFLGRLEEERLIEIYQDCDALLFPSRFEGFGYAALEAMACGKPVIASNSSSLPEVVEDGACGILCEPDNVNAFAQACRRLAEDPALRRRMGEAARERAVRLFSEEAIMPKYIQLFEELSGKGPVRH
ncbi:glycosyltransferase family 4 protein [Pelomicrobium sp. G1]|uniref:glycosyltransferase family 4 protein n=1 Tax=unclassified Pelomicrobium TaxID=2815318 RepID=UPI003F77353B